jgi:hypothetical protein
MAKVERLREVVAGLPGSDYVREKAAEGWKLVAVEWEREVSEGEQETGRIKEEIPFGLKVSKDCLHLEEDPGERQALLLMLEMIVEDKTMSQVADELNRLELRTRRGTKWTQPAIFAMLPRLIEVAPRIFSSEEWVTRKVRQLSPL